MEIQARLKGGEPISVTYDMPETLDSLVERFGAEVIAGKALDSLVIDVQALVRRHLKGTDKVAAKGADEIQAIVSAWLPGVGVVRKSSVEKISTLIASMTAEQKADLLAQLRG